MRAFCGAGAGAGTAEDDLPVEQGDLNIENSLKLREDGFTVDTKHHQSNGLYQL